MSEAAPVIVSALFGGEDQARFDRLRQAYFPPERNVLAAHLTLFHHLPPSVLPELKRRLGAATRDVAAPPAAIGGLLNLGRGVAVRIASDRLAAIRAELADAFAPLLTPQDRAGWRAHVTVQNKVTPAEARQTLALLGEQVDRRPVRIAGLATWYYRGGPWEPISRYLFAGAQTRNGA